jgi:integrase/recombinase XerD
LAWFIEDVWAHFGGDHRQPQAPLFPSERRGVRRVGYDSLRSGLVDAVAEHLPAWTDKLSPHVLRHYCASQMYLSGVDLIAIQAGASCS